MTVRPIERNREPETAGPGFSSDAVIVGTSARMRAVFDLVRLVADSAGTVLITGESGTGKEVIAHLIHHLSRRRHRPFVAVSCAVFNDMLIESELFGHERGAFTGAVKDRPGRFELAQGGTIFLDDIDDVPLSMQVKLLRVLQNRTIERLGGVRTIPVDVRIVAGAKRSLRQLVTEGKFREDLYYRVNVLPVSLPPLRERREDIPALTDHFLGRFFGRRGEAPPPLPAEMRRAFERYSWPGNVRELENLCERIALTTVDGHLDLGAVPENPLGETMTGEGIAAAAGPHQTVSVTARPPLDAPLDPPPPADISPLPVSLDDQLRQVEAHLIGWALRVTGGNKSRAADLLRVKRSTLGDRINRCGLDGSAAAHEATHAMRPSA